MSNVTNIPISDRMTRERVYKIVYGRIDKKDAIAQLVITLDEVIQKGFTGKIVLNCDGSGSITNVQVIESQKV